MQLEYLFQLLNEVKDQTLPVEKAVERLRLLPFEEFGGEVHLDHHRSLRSGFPEVVFAQGKTPSQIIEIFHKLAQTNNQVLVTRLEEQVYEQIRPELLPEAQYNPKSRTLILDKQPQRQRLRGIIVVTAGTADLPVAEEAAVTAEIMGNQVERIIDVGVSGLHRLLNYLPKLQAAHVIIVAAGMEGALPSVVGGLVAVPVIAVPTSVGYGANFGGISALLAMLNSCANGVAVMNIDNGYGAGVLASKINRLAWQNTPSS